MWLGRTQAGDLSIDPAALARHVAVYGATGAGKTWLAKSIVEEAALAGIATLVFDVQGDLTQLVAARAGVAGPLAERQARFVATVEPRIFTPASDAGLRLSLNPLRLPETGASDDARAFCLDAMAECLLGAIEVPKSWRNLARSYLAQHLAAATGALDLGQFIERLEDPTLLPDRAVLEGAPRLRVLVEQLRLLTVGTQAILFARGRPFSVEDMLRPFQPGKTPLNVLWLNALGDLAMKQRFIAFTLYEIYSWMLRHPSDRPQLLVYFDEVGPYMPPVKEPPSKAALRRIFQEGRKYGVSGLLCTQNLTDVDYKILAQASTLAVGRVGSPQDRERLEKMLGSPRGFSVPAALDRLARGKTGTFLVWGPDRDESPRWLDGRGLLTQHGPPWGEDEIARHTPAAMKAAWNP